MEEELNKRLGKAVLKTLSFIKQNTPVNTGRLRNSIVVQKDGDNYIIGTNTEYALGVEIGTEPHIIKPKTKKALYWKGAAHPYKKVNHPGTEGRFMFLKGAKYFQKLLQEEFKK